MNCTFKDPNLIKKIVDALASGVEILNLYVTANGINVTATNATNTDLRQLVLQPTWFESFTCTHDCVLGVNMPLLQKFMGTAGPKDKITWFHNEGSRFFNITIEGAGESKSIKDWTLFLVDFDADALTPPPNPTFNVSFRVSTVLVSEWIKDCKIIMGNIDFGIEKDKHITIKSESDIGQFEHKHTIPSVMATVYQSEPDFTAEKQRISNKEADHLNTMIKCAPGVDLQFHPSMPLCATSYLDAEQTSFIRLWIAPMANDDELSDED